MNRPHLFFKPTLVCASIIVACMSLCGQRTTRRSLKTAAVAETVICDTIASASDSTAFRFAGYEKPLRATREVFFSTNNTDSAVSRLDVTLIYKDMDERILDSRKVSIENEFPPHETRRVEISSWDKQKVFYYHRSPVPRTRQATPYRIRICLDAALLKR